MAINIGLEDSVRKQISICLSRILANEFFLYIKTLNFHWNITGESFIALHKFLEEHYEWLKETVDEIAERIRTIGYIAPGTYKKYVNENLIINEGSENQTEQAMLSELLNDYENMIKLIRKSISEIDDLHDYGTEDMMTEWLKQHEKRAWMLRSHLQNKPSA